MKMFCATKLKVRRRFLCMCGLFFCVGTYCQFFSKLQWANFSQVDKKDLGGRPSWSETAAEAEKMRQKRHPLKWTVLKCYRLPPGLPDFPWYNVPKWGKMFQMIARLPNGHKIFLTYTNIFLSKALQNVPK
jgi:hypothetical protein